MAEITKLIGDRLKVIRKSRGLTQEKLAELVGLEPQSISYMESGRFAPSPDTLQKLSEALNAKPYEFYYFDEVSPDFMEKVLFNALKNDKKMLKTFYNIYKSIEYLES